MTLAHYAITIEPIADGWGWTVLVDSLGVCEGRSHSPRLAFDTALSAAADHYELTTGALWPANEVSR